MGIPTVERSRAVEDYVKAIHAIADDGGDRSVGTTALASHLGVTPASASGMVRKLATLGLATSSPYRGVTLTEDGELLALSILRRHRLLETFLAQRLGIPWDRVHAEAEVLEHVLSVELEAAIANNLGNPDRDPHGAPIPRSDLTVEEQQTFPLEQLAEGDRVRFVRIPDERPEMLRWLSERGIAPGAEIELKRREPFGGPLTAAIGGREHQLGVELAAAIRVEYL